MRLIKIGMLLAGAMFVFGCGQGGDIDGTDPSNCEAIKADFPEEYEKCLDELSG